MMMAHNSSQGPIGLSEQTIDAVRAALAAYIDDPSSGDPLRHALHILADEARRKNVFAEQLLVVLKDIWYSLPAVRRMHEQAEQVRLLQRVVTMCIKEYYTV